MTTAGQPQNNNGQIEINNNNGNALDLDENNDNDQDSFSVSDEEENTSEYGHSPPGGPSAISNYPNQMTGSSAEAEDNRNNNTSHPNNETVPPSLVSSMESEDNILNNNDVLVDRSEADEDTSSAYYNALGDSTASTHGVIMVQKDSNDNQVDVRQQVQVKWMNYVCVWMCSVVGCVEGGEDLGSVVSSR